jgi:hypothetical protein
MTVFKPSDHAPSWPRDEDVDSCECGAESVNDFRTWREHVDELAKCSQSATTQPDPDGAVEMTDGEWAAFRGHVQPGADTLGQRIRDVLARSGVPAEVALQEWAAQADALEQERDQWHESAEFAAERIDRVRRIFEAVESSATDANLVDRVLRALDGTQ